jgi:predicted unusual protein kinase regulating ubiquinone biosynthesis (AarF/ABC1/UbiB family)
LDRRDFRKGAGAIAQAHLARLHSGEQVVVKVQHPGIADKIMPGIDDWKK